MNESSDDYCQNCISDYGKYENNCYHKSEKFYNLYYENINQTWNECEINNNNFICSICPKGTYIKESSSQTCEKCKKGEYSDNEDKINCEKCPIGYYSDILGSSYCKKCPEGYTSLIGSDKCYKDCEPGYYANGDICSLCKPGYYSEKSSTECNKCPLGTFNSFSGNNHC